MKRRTFYQSYKFIERKQKERSMHLVRKCVVPGVLGDSVVLLFFEAFKNIKFSPLNFEVVNGSTFLYHRVYRYLENLHFFRIFLMPPRKSIIWPFLWDIFGKIGIRNKSTLAIKTLAEQCKNYIATVLSKQCFTEPFNIKIAFYIRDYIVWLYQAILKLTYHVE